jgi:hypothetical protein
MRLSLKELKRLIREVEEGEGMPTGDGLPAWDMSHLGEIIRRTGALEDKMWKAEEEMRVLNEECHDLLGEIEETLVEGGFVNSDSGTLFMDIDAYSGLEFPALNDALYHRGQCGSETLDEILAELKALEKNLKDRGAL